VPTYQNRESGFFDEVFSDLYFIRYPLTPTSGRVGAASRHSCLSVSGRDGCPQPSVRGQRCAPPSTSSPLSANGGLGTTRPTQDNSSAPASQQFPSSPCPFATPSLWVGTAVPSRPFADRDAHLLRPPLLSSANGGLGEPRPTQDNSSASQLASRSPTRPPAAHLYAETGWGTTPIRL
jgi:hypothetical protein